MLKFYHVQPEGDPLGGSREAEKIAVALNEIGEEFELISMSRARDLRPPGNNYRKNINHMGTVPTLDDDGFLLRESGAILNYLANKFPAAGLLPTDPQGKAKALEWVFWEGTTYVLTVINLCFLHPFKDLDPEPFDALLPYHSGDKEADLANAYDRVGMMFKHLDNELSGKEYIADNHYSIGDIAIGAHVALVGQLDFDLKPYPNVVTWLNRLSDRPAWQAEPVFATDLKLIRDKGLM